MNRFLPAGKLPPNLLGSLLSRLSREDPRVIVGPGIGQDAAVIDMGDRYLVAKTDPITFATEEIGWYAVHVNANDVACMGARPRWFMATALLPAGRTDAEVVEAIFDQIREACQSLQVTLVGGHTEITHNLDRPLVVGAMLGEVSKEKLVTIRGARPGDALLLTKQIPLEGTALIAREKHRDLVAQGVSEEVIWQCQRLLHDPGISVVREAMLAAETGHTTAMHDPTEGGLATGLWEMAHAARVGLEIQEEAIPYSSDGAQLCSALGLDPLGVISSGSLLLSVTSAHAEEIRILMEQNGIASSVIGRIVSSELGVTLVRGSDSRPLPQFQVDEIARIS